MYTKLGSNIRKVREIKNFNQNYVADKLKVSQSYYSEIENDKADLSKERFYKIAQALEVDPEIILRFDDQVVFNFCSQSGQHNTYNIQQEKALNKAHEKLILSLESQIIELKEVIEVKDEIIAMLKN